MVTQVSTLLTNHTTLRAANGGLQKIVEDLCDTSEIAMARIWLVQANESCEICQSRNELDKSQEPCLHLVASAGQSRNPTTPEVWNRLGGAFHRFPLNSQKIGHIGATGKPLLVHHTKGETALLNPDWLSQEGIQSFFGYPVVIDGHIGGVFAVFSRAKLTERDLGFLKQIVSGAARLLKDASNLAEQRSRLDSLESENEHLRTDLNPVGSMGSIVALGPASRKLDEQIRLAATHGKPVLIHGERGSGKKFTARLLHQYSGNRNHSFVKVHGKALSSEVLESLTRNEGRASDRHESRQHVSAPENRTSRTLFIEMVEQTPAEVQEQLANVLFSPSFGMIQGHSSDHVTSAVRIIASTELDLKAEVAAERFRHDLYCALSVTEIEVPPLRQRPEDLPMLANEIMSDLCHREHREPWDLDPAAFDRLLHYDWPGNVRELQYVLGCAVMRCQGGRIVLDGFLNPDRLAFTEDQAPSFVRADAMRRQERANVIACLKKTNWKVYGSGGAAERLGIKPTTLMYRMKVLGIRKPTR